MKIYLTGSFRRTLMWATCMSVVSIFAHGREAPAVEKMECAGQFKFALPGPVEFALTQREAFLDCNGQDYIAFADESMPREAAFALSRKVDISRETSREDFTTLRAEALAMTQKDKKDLIRKGKNDIADLIKPFELGGPDAFAWSSAAGVEVFFYKGGHIYRFNAHSDGTQKDEGARAKEFFANMKARKMFEVPSEKGICYPYSFLKTDKPLEYTAGVGMRLTEHPEVEILVRDSEPLAPNNPMKMDPQAKIKFFMETLLTDTFSKIDYHWQLKPFVLAGSPGKAAFVNVRRGDKQNDVVFIASVPGVATKTGPARDLLLYVSRNASLAKGVPMSEPKFRELAEAIAKSVTPLQ